MAKTNSLRDRIRSLKVGETLEIPKTSYLPSVVRTTTYSVAADLWGVKYTTKLTPTGTQVARLQ